MAMIGVDHNLIDVTDILAVSALDRRAPHLGRCGIHGREERRNDPTTDQNVRFTGLAAALARRSGLWLATE